MMIIRSVSRWEKTEIFCLNELRGGSLTYKEAERRWAGWEGCKKLQNAEARVSHIQVVVCSTLFTAELLQSPPLHAVPCMLHQSSQKRLTETQKSDALSPEAVLHLRQPQLSWLLQKGEPATLYTKSEI